MSLRFASSLRYQLTLSHFLVALTLSLGMGAVTVGVVGKQARTLQAELLERAENLAGEKVQVQIGRLEETRDVLAREVAVRSPVTSHLKDLLFLHGILSRTGMDRLEVFRDLTLVVQAYDPESGGEPELATTWYPQNPQVAALLLEGRPVTWLQVPPQGRPSIKSAVQVSSATSPERLFVVVTLAINPSWLAGGLPLQTRAFLRSGQRILGAWPPESSRQTAKPRLGVLAGRRVIARLTDDSSIEVEISTEGRALLSALLPAIRGGVLVTLISLGIALIVGETLARRFLAPLDDLLEGTAAMARGHLSVRLQVRRQDELGALTREFNRMADELRTTYLGVISTLAEVVEAKSHYTREHIERVERLAMATAHILEERGWAKWSAHQKFTLSVAAILHDVGKIAIGNEILNKAGPLTGGERSEVLSHPEVGAKIVEKMGKLDRAAEIIRACHEHYDGSGYPRGLKGQEIPLEARIILAVDAFDAMTQQRPYSKARPLEDAIAELRAEAGKQFDPVVVEALIEAVRRDLRGETSQKASSSGFYQALTNSSEDGLPAVN